MSAIPYAILNSEGRCINILMWDGVSNWQPPNGCIAVPNIGGEYKIYSETQSPQPDYVGFYNGLLGSSVYHSVLTQPATADLARAMVVFVSAIQDCMAGAGRENRPAMQGAIWLLLSQIPLDMAHAAELTGLMQQHHLAGVYQLQPPAERARDASGQFVADDPATPDVDEAWQ